jgi:PAS domain S-box-containing protein
VKDVANSIELRSRAALLDSQRRVLERIASGAPLAESLETLVRLIEEQARGMRCAVLLADSLEQRLSFIAAPSIPEDYKTGMAPFLRIAPNMGSCGTAAFAREPVYSSDTRTDALWEDCRDVAVRNGLLAIWSTPILGDDNRVLGTFAMYYGEPRLPSPEHVQLIDMAVQMARVAIEAKHIEEALQRSEDRLRLVIDTIPTMVWSVLPDGAIDLVNQRWLDYTGFSFEKALKEGNHIVHPDDLPGILEKWSVDKAAGNPCEYELRLRRADGEYRWFLVRTVPLRDRQGNIVKWYGTSFDIEDRKRAEDTLRRNQAFFVAEAQRIGRLLETQAPGDLPLHPSGDEVAAAADRGDAAGRPPSGPGAGESTIPADRRLVAERQTIESLTSNERAILQLITEGKSNAEVGELLHLSPRTVETYRGRLMQKLRVEDLVALVKFAIRHGIASVD